LAFESFLPTSAELGAGGLAELDPDGRAAPPVAFGSGVSAANAVALVIRTAAKTKLGSWNI
jgi:hypothetical protein